MSKEFWDKVDKMTPEEKKKLRQTQLASACQDAAEEQEKRGRSGCKKNREGRQDEDEDKQEPEVRT